ncbi:hypothetical protein B4100_1993 [Heyndrickxia coagulans]|nr:hypothetical protein B4100_1993 [Heyndrickxia coagulans]
MKAQGTSENAKGSIVSAIAEWSSGYESWWAPLTRRGVITICGLPSFFAGYEMNEK